MKLIRQWGPVLVWMGIIFFFSSRQRVQVSHEYILNFLFFKTLHVLEYAMLYFLTFRASKNSRLSFFITILYAISDEVHQTFVPTRDGKLQDVIIDALGASLAWLWIAQLLPKMPRKLQKWGRMFLTN